MKEGMYFGLAVGLVIGALLYKHCDDAKTLVDKGEKMAKQEIKKMKETTEQAVSKKKN